MVRKFLMVFSVGLLLLTAAVASADTQTLTSTPTATVVQAGNDVDVSVRLDTDNTSSNGAAFYVHYDSSKLSFNESTGVQAVFLTGSELSDPSDSIQVKAEDRSDGDSGTDKVIVVAWAQIGGWPGSTPIAELIKLRFNSSLQNNESTSLNFTQTSGAATFNAESVALYGPDTAGPVITQASDPLSIVATDASTQTYTIPSTTTAVDAVQGDVSGTLRVVQVVNNDGPQDYSASPKSAGDSISLAYGQNVLIWYATDGSNDATDSQTINVVAADATDSTTVISADPTTATVAGTSTVSITVLDEFGHPRVSDTVNFSVNTTGSGGSIDASDITDASGTATATLTLSTDATDNVVTATAGNVIKTVTVSGTRAALAASTVGYTNSDVSQTAGFNATVYVLVKDSTGTVVENQPVYFVVNQGSVVSQPGVTNSSGITSGTVTHNATGDVVVTAYIGTDSSGTQVTDTHTVAFQKASLSIGTIRTLSADGTDSVDVLVSVVNQSDQTITTATDTITLTVSGGASAEFTGDSTPDAVSGVATGTLQTTYSNSASGSFTITATSPNYTSDTETITVEPLALEKGGSAVGSMLYMLTSDVTDQTITITPNFGVVTGCTTTGSGTCTVANASDSISFTSPSSEGTDTLTVTGAVGESTSSTDVTLNVVSYPAVSFVSPGARAEAYLHGADGQQVNVLGGDGSYTFTIVPSNGVSSEVATFDDASSTGTVVNASTCTGGTGDCFIKVATGRTTTTVSGTSDTLNAIRISVGDGTDQLATFGVDGVADNTPSFTNVDVSDTLEVTFKLGKVGSPDAVTDSALGLVINEISSGGRQVHAVLNGVDVAADGSVTIQDQATLKMSAIKSGTSTKYEKTLTNSGANIVSASSDQVTINFNNLRAAILNAYPELDINVVEDGYYEYRIITGAAIAVGTTDSTDTSSATLSTLPRIAEDQSEGLDLSSLFASATYITASDRSKLNGGSLIQGQFVINGAPKDSSDTVPSFPASEAGALTLTGTPYTLSDGITNNQIKLTVDSVDHTVALSQSGVVTTDSYSNVDTSDSVSVTFDLSGSGVASGTIGFAIFDYSGTGRAIYALLDSAEVNNGTVTVPANAKLYVHGVKSDMTTVDADFTNADVNVVNTSGSTVTLQLTNLRDNIQQAFVDKGLSNDLSSFATPNGYYRYHIFLDKDFPVAYKTSNGYSSLPRIPLNTMGGSSIKGTQGGYFTGIFSGTAATVLDNLADAHMIYGDVQINGEPKRVSTAESGFSLSVEGSGGTSTQTSGSDATGTFVIHAADGLTYTTSDGTDTNEADSANIEVFSSLSFAVEDASGNMISGDIQLSTVAGQNSITLTGTPDIKSGYECSTTESTDTLVLSGAGNCTVTVQSGAVDGASYVVTVKDTTYGTTVYTTVNIVVSTSELTLDINDSDWASTASDSRKVVEAGETILVNFSSNNASLSGDVRSTDSYDSGVMTWTAPDTGAFAGHYDITITDTLGLTQDIYITVPYSIKVSEVDGVETDAVGMLSTETMRVTASGGSSSQDLTLTVMDSNDSTDTSAFITSPTGDVTATPDASGTVDVVIDPTDSLVAVTGFKVKVSDGSDTDLDATLSGLTIFPTDAYVVTVTSDGTTPISGATVFATSVFQKDGSLYITDATGTDASGTARLNLPKHAVSGSYHKLMVVADGYVAQEVTPTALATTVTLTTAARTISGTVSGLPSSGTKSVTVMAFYDANNVRNVVAEQLLVIQSGDTSGTFSIAMDSSEYDSSRSYTLLGRVKGYLPATDDISDTVIQAGHVTGASLVFTDAITVEANTSGVRSAVNNKVASIFAGDSDKITALETELNSARVVIQPPAVSAFTGVELSFEDYTEEGISSETIAALQKVAMVFPPFTSSATVTLDASSTIRPMVHIPETGGLSSTAAAKLETTPVSFNLSVTNSAGVIQGKDDVNAILRAAYDAGSPVILTIPRGNMPSSDLLSGDKVIRYADTLEDLVNDNTASSIPRADIIDAGELTGQVRFKVRHLTVFGGGAAPAAAATAAAAGGGGCFIATAAYGSYEAPYVKLLREFRDQVLLSNGAGQWFVEQYYTYSPPMADWIRDREAVKAVVRVALIPLIATSWVILEATVMQQLMVLFGLVALMLLPSVLRRRRTVADERS